MADDETASDTPRAEREARLAQALRANLRRRKAGDRLSVPTHTDSDKRG
jgi:hypothetical protein